MHTFLALICGIFSVGYGLETTSEKRRHGHIRRKVKAAPTLSISQLLEKSAELTKKFERQAVELRSKVQDIEQGEPGDPGEPGEPVEEETDPSLQSGSSFLQTSFVKPGVADEGLKAMEAVNEEILRYTDRMRKLGNEASLFYRK